MIICITGLAGAGKSLVADNLKNLLEEDGINVVQYNSDWIAKNILCHKYDFKADVDYSSDDLTTIYQAMYLLFREVLKDKNTVIITDGMYRKASQRLTLQLIAKELNVPFKLIYLNADSNLTKQRVEDRLNKGGHGGWVDPKEYENYFDSSTIRIENNKSVSTLNNNVEKVVDIILNN